MNLEGGQIYNLLCELEIVEESSSRQPAAFNKTLFGDIRVCHRLYKSFTLGKPVAFLLQVLPKGVQRKLPRRAE